MNANEFKGYLDRFERDIVVQGIEAGLLGKSMMVPLRRGKLDTTDFGKTLGLNFHYDEPAAIDYYGFIKKSSGLMDYTTKSDVQVSAVKAPIVHFASIKVEDISDLSLDLVKDFPEFKKMLVALRSFKKKGE